MDYALAIHGLPVGNHQPNGYPWTTHKLLMGYPQTTTGNPWTNHGLPMGYH